jgi:hypothetical protein
VTASTAAGTTAAAAPLVRWQGRAVADAARLLTVAVQGRQMCALVVDNRRSVVLLHINGAWDGLPQCGAGLHAWALGNVALVCLAACPVCANRKRELLFVVCYNLATVA